MLPAFTKDDNITSTTMTVKLSPYAQHATFNVQRSVSDAEKPYNQYRLLDVYDAIEKDNKKRTRPTKSNMCPEQITNATICPITASAKTVQ
ncbi:hypothetical protein [Parachryseolinea silvisoli]|uniref:hypothetical protein n=1 Tax=Parachryseolinea silvisoli TaxID=2873601 RepID=UPI002265A500|nr:hypothetical protein [Parachryseolinea silvisoli]MCD9019951.1 hypothetical protein [Parachryseolinea silvisoli]